MRTRTRVWIFVAIAVSVIAVAIITVVGMTLGVVISQHDGDEDNGSDGGGTDEVPSAPPPPSHIGSFNDPTSLRYYWDVVSSGNTPTGNAFYTTLRSLVGTMTLDADGEL